MIRQIVIVMSSFLLFGSSLLAGEFSTDNTLVINTVIDKQTMGPVMAKAQAILSLPEAVPEINIIIDSPGGSVDSGFQFITIMAALRDNGTKINCYVPGMAASMAFQILTQCDKRIVVQNSALLWHRARVMIGGMFGAVLTAPQADTLAKELQATDDHILDQLTPALADLTKEQLLYHFEHESMHVGQNLCKIAPHFCTSVTSVPGLLQALRDSSFAHTEMPKQNVLFKKNEIIYVYPKFLEFILNH